MAKRKIFDELAEGVAAMKGQREGKVILCSYKIKAVHLRSKQRINGSPNW